MLIGRCLDPNVRNNLIVGQEEGGEEGGELTVDKQRRKGKIHMIRLSCVHLFVSYSVEMKSENSFDILMFFLSTEGSKKDLQPQVWMRAACHYTATNTGRCGTN